MKRSELIIVLIIAIVVGIVTGFSAVLYNFILSSGASVLSRLLLQEKILYLIIPIIGASLSSVLYFFGKYDVNYGLGVGQVLAEIKLYKSQLIKPTQLVFNVISSWITLIFGFTAGRFGPIVHMGASIGSILAYKMSLSPENLRLLIGCGIGGTIASVFGLPLFAVVFVSEVIFREAIYKNMAPLLLAAYVSYGISKYLGVLKPLLPMVNGHFIFDYSFKHTLFLIFLSIVVIVLSISYVSCIEWFTSIFKRVKSQYFRFFIVAIVVGISAYILPLQMELHSATLTQLLTEELSIKVLLILILFHILTAGMTLGSGYIGGSFFPSLVIGSAGSVLFYEVSHTLFSLTYDLKQVGVLGACSMVGAIMNAPITAIALCIELTQSMSYLMPIILVVSISVSFSYLILQRDIFTKTVQRILKNNLKKEYISGS